MDIEHNIITLFIIKRAKLWTIGTGGTNDLVI